MTLLRELEVPVAQWVKCWPTDLAVLGCRPAGGCNLLNHKRGSIAHSLLLSLTHHPHLTEILLKRTEIASHPSIILDSYCWVPIKDIYCYAALEPPHQGFSSPGLQCMLYTE